MEVFEQIMYWHWLVVGIVLMGLEILDGSGHMIWFGISALLVGLVKYMVPELSWLPQIILFATFTCLSLIAWKTYKKNNPEEDKFPTLNRRGSGYIGRTFTLSEAIVDGEGKVKVDDTIWIVRGEDMAEGSKVKVKDLDGTAFLVEEIS